MQGSQQRQYRRSSQSGRDPARPGKVIASAEPDIETNAARAGVSERKEPRRDSSGVSTQLSPLVGFYRPATATRSRDCELMNDPKHVRVGEPQGVEPSATRSDSRMDFARAGRTPGTNLSAWRCLRTNSPNHYHTRPARRVWHVAGGIPAALSISKFECSSKRESARGCQPERSQAGPPTTLGVTSDDPSSRGNVRHAATTFRPACADADSPIRDNHR